MVQLRNNSRAARCLSCTPPGTAMCWSWTFPPGNWDRCVWAGMDVCMATSIKMLTTGAGRPLIWAQSSWHALWLAHHLLIPKIICEVNDAPRTQLNKRDRALNPSGPMAEFTSQQAALCGQAARSLHSSGVMCAGQGGVPRWQWASSSGVRVAEPALLGPSAHLQECSYRSCHLGRPN